MSTAISVENIGKKYLISHQVEEPHATLREALRAQAGRFVRALAGGRPAQAATSEEFWALRDVGFEVQTGDRIGVIGRNGAGKSTLLKILSRITQPSTGRVRLRGRVASLLEVGTGFHPELTGRENIFLNAAVLGMSRAETAARFDEIVAFSEVEKFLDTPVKRYSSGMYVRLAFAVAAHLEPEILIVDEVLSVGDAQFQKKCMGKMEQVGKDGRTIIFVSHSMATVNRLCSRSLLLREGRVVESGDTQAVIRTYLSENMLKATEYELPHDRARDMHLRKVVLNPGKSERSAELRYDEPIVLRVEYEINRPVHGCTVWVALQTMEGTMVFCTADHDLDLAMLGDRAPGYYHADISIPGKWLNVGEYNVIVGVVKNNPVIVYDREETLSFDIAEIGTPGSITQDGVRRGVLQPFLPWTTAQVSGPVVK